MAARSAFELGLGLPVIRADVPTSGAPLGRVARVYGDDFATGALSLVRDHSQQQLPPGIMNRTVQSGLGFRPVRIEAACLVRPRHGPADQIRDVQVLVDNQVVVIDQAARQLVSVVETLVTDLAVTGSHPLDGPTSVRGTPPLRGQLPLRLREPAGRSTPVTRVLDVFTVGCREQVGDPEIQTH
jgi:hypothetical protein